MKRIKNIKRKKGSFLVEVLLTVVILSVSLTLIIQSLMSSLRASMYSYGYSTALLLLENKMFDIFSSDSADSLALKEGRFDKPYERYEYAVDVDSLDNQDELSSISEVNLEVTWDFGGRQKKVSVDTYHIGQTE